MKKIYHYLIVSFLIISSLMLYISSISLAASQYTGHSGFSDVKFVDGGSLLIDMEAEEIAEGRKKVGSAKFWGWKHHYFNINKKILYVGETIFSKGNLTNASFVINYQLKESTTTENSLNTSGSISAKVAATIKKVSLTGNGSFEIDSTKSNKTVHSEETSIKITINPYRKVTLRLCGEAYVTNATSKYYVFGICIRKGEWETIEVGTCYYELVEEVMER